MQINKNIAISETGFVFNPISGDSFSTNPCGQEILKKLKSDISFNDLVEFISDTFSVDKSTTEKDIADFIIMLKSYQILIDDEQA